MYNDERLSAQQQQLWSSAAAAAVSLPKKKVQFFECFKSYDEEQ